MVHLAELQIRETTVDTSPPDDGDMGYAGKERRRGRARAFSRRTHTTRDRPARTTTHARNSHMHDYTSRQAVGGDRKRKPKTMIACERKRDAQQAAQRRPNRSSTNPHAKHDRCTRRNARWQARERKQGGHFHAGTHNPMRSRADKCSNAAAPPTSNLTAPLAQRQLGARE
jgi:hypothetical protein